MLFSHSAAYAVRALTWLACQPKDSRWLATDVASREGIPRPYLSKVLGVLKTQGLISSVRGPNGGYVLVQDPDSISLMHVLTLFDSENGLLSARLPLETAVNAHSARLGMFGTARERHFSTLWKLPLLDR
ncbi:MAG: Rrf2 family transcriptional regulator [bacterium]|nr:Rrf2 family transcriptional regulator [bacterium]